MIKILSLFDGISGAQVALKRAGISYDEYYASEIDPYAIKITQKNFPETKQLGDVTKIKGGDYYLLIGGSPCQGFSKAGDKLNFDDHRSKLFFEYVRILKECREHNPDIWFVLENVKMKKEWRDVISDYLKIEPILINSSLVSGQNRERYYWTNIPKVEQPEDKGILLKDVLISGYHITDDIKSATIDANYHKGGSVKNHGTVRFKQLRESERRMAIVDNASMLLSQKEKSYMDRKVEDGRTHWDFHHHHDTDNPKSSAIVANTYKGVPYNVLIDRRGEGVMRVGTAFDIRGHDYNKRIYSGDGKSPTLAAHTGGNLEPKVAVSEIFYRKLLPVECERLQTYDDGYTEGVSKTQRYKALGNSFTVDVIAHILKHIPNK